MSLRIFAGITSICLLALFNTVRATPVEINWQANGGANQFERQAITFDPIKVESFIGFYSDGTFRNGVNTQGSSWFKALIQIRIENEWVNFAENDHIGGPWSSERPLDGFVFLPIDFSRGPISGIYLATTGFGQSEYLGMTTAGLGTRFIFEAAELPEPGTLVLVALGMIAALIARRRSRFNGA